MPHRDFRPATNRMSWRRWFAQGLMFGLVALSPSDVESIGAINPTVLDSSDTI
jgi:hypothetical protein